MTNRYNKPLYQIAAMVFVVSLPLTAGIAFLGPRVLGLGAINGWMMASLLALGLVCAVTGPLAWRWFWLRSKE